MQSFRTFSAIILFFCLGLLFSGLKALFAERGAAATDSLPAIIFVEAPTVAWGKLTTRFPQGSHLAEFPPGVSSHSPVNLTPEFFAATDPEVSFDATKVLFSAKRTRSGRWQVWEMNANGSGKRQLTHCPSACIKPVDLPNNQIVFTMVQGNGGQQTSAIYVAEQNGTGAHPITFGPGNFKAETVLRNGRILVSANTFLVAGGNSNDSRMFYTLRPDGSGLSPFRWNSAQNFIRSGATELNNGTVLFVKRQSPERPRQYGELAGIRPGALHNSVITPASPEYWSAHELDENRLVVSKLASGQSGRAAKLGLYVFNLLTKRVESTVYRNPRFSELDAVPLEPRRVPLRYLSILHPDRDYGRVVCLDAYLSANAPHGRLAGEIARVRVIALQPDHHSERVLGEAPVESDGSFYIKVPADRPIRFELLNRNSAVIHEQKSWIWARTGEDVPCLGCHESKALVPRDHWPLALKRPGAPIPVGVASNSQPAKH